MISVRNRLPQLNGNRRRNLFRISNVQFRIYLFAALLIYGCSPKTVQPHAPVNKPAETKPAPVVKPAAPVKVEPKVSNIALLLPFGLDHIGPGQSYDDVGFKKAQIAADYYRGFKLALDSLTYYGYNYKLQLFDTKDEPSVAHNLVNNAKIRSSNLVVGPVFPDDMKAFGDAFGSTHKMVVSPLSPEPPANFHNPNLVTVNPPLEYHAWCTAQFISKKVKPQKIFILRSGYSEENDYIIPFSKAIDSLGKKHIKIITITIVRGQLTPILPQLTPGKQNIFIVPSTDQAFLTVTLHSLDLLTARYPVMVFGHPSWAHFAFLRATLLQHLKTHITSTDKIDYKSAETVTFIHNYRNVWHTEPSVYAIKGFDEGLYFGQLLGSEHLKDIGAVDFNGLHNRFHFEKKPGQGWINTHVNLLLYENFELKKVE